MDQPFGHLFINVSQTGYDWILPEKAYAWHAGAQSRAHTPLLHPPVAIVFHTKAPFKELLMVNLSLLNQDWVEKLHSLNWIFFSEYILKRMKRWRNNTFIESQVFYMCNLNNSTIDLGEDRLISKKKPRKTLGLSLLWFYLWGRGEKKQMIRLIKAHLLSMKQMRISKALLISLLFLMESPDAFLWNC